MARRQPRKLVKTGAPPRSLYRKIQIVLAEVRRNKHKSEDDLISQIFAKGHLDFTRYKTVPAQETILVPCSVDSVRKVISVCVSLRLVDSPKIELTTSGLRAVDSNRYDEVIRRSVPLALKSLGTSIEQVKEAISQLLSIQSETQLPTGDVIFEKLKLNGGNEARNHFRSYLSLLAAAQGVSYSRKKIYLP